MNGFSKKIENHVAALSLHFMYYNFVRITRRSGSLPQCQLALRIACGR